MNLKQKTLTVGVVFFFGFSLFEAQSKSDSSKISNIEEVVVIGYGKQKRTEVTTSISKINGQDMANLVTPSVQNQMAGRAAGVQVTTPSGVLGESPRIRIRGVATISSGTQPLYVVDGVPVFSGDQGVSANANAIGDINPNDIESIDILKDGAATAIYGSRGANGVVLITTKRGKKGPMKVNFSLVNGWAFPYKLYDLLETPDFLVIANEKRTNAGATPWAAGSDYNTDWQGVVLNKGAAQMDANVSLSGGNDATKYYFSGGYTNMEGIGRPNAMKRYSFKANIDHKLAKWLTVGANVALTKSEYNSMNRGQNSLSGNIFNAIRQLPNTPVYDSSNPTGYNINLSTGNMGQWDNLQPVGDNITNIAYIIDKNKFQSDILRVLLNSYLEFNILKGLTYRFQVGTDSDNNYDFRYLNPIHGDGRSVKGSLRNYEVNSLRWNVQNILNYNRNFNGGHNVSFTGVVEYQKDREKYFFGSGQELIDSFFNQNLVTDSYVTKDSGGGITEEGLISYVARASYNYKQRYFVQGSLRRDGLSKFAPDQRWYTFPGISLGWNVANENFFSSAKDVVNDLKFRGSYSETGNTEIGSRYPYLNLSSASPYGTLSGIAWTQMGNSILTWETSKKYDYGLDVSFLRNKINLTLDYFENNQNGLVLRRQIAPSIGVPDNIIYTNIGTSKNKGFEFSIDYKAISKENISLSLGANLTLQENKITSVPGGKDIIGGSSSDSNIAPNLIIREGYSLNSLYGFEYWGVNPANGRPVYVKADGTLVQGNPVDSSYSTFDPNNPSAAGTASSLTQADKKILGNTIPRYFGGFNTKLRVKNVDFSMLWRFSGGNKIFNATRRDLLTQNLNNNSTEILGRWQSASNPGDGWTPMLYSANNNFINQTSNATSRFVEKGDFVSLDNLTIGYSFPKSLTEKLNVNNIRMFVQGQNIWIITKYKGLSPEMETHGVDYNTTPISSVYSIGINVNL